MKENDLTKKINQIQTDFDEVSDNVTTAEGRVFCTIMQIVLEQSELIVDLRKDMCSLESKYMELEQKLTRYTAMQITREYLRHPEPVMDKVVVKRGRPPSK